MVSLIGYKGPIMISSTIRFTYKYQIRHLELLQIPQNPSPCTNRYAICHFDYTIGR